MHMYALCSYIILTTEDTVFVYMVLSGMDHNCVSAVQNVKPRQSAAILPDGINVNWALLGFLRRMNLMWIRCKSKFAFLLS